MPARTPAPTPVSTQPRGMIDPTTYDALRAGLGGDYPSLTPGMVGGPTPYGTPKAMFPTAAGVPGLQQWALPALGGYNTQAFVYTAPPPPKAPPLSPAIFAQPNETQQTLAHETEHLLARQALGSGSKVNKVFDGMVSPAGGSDTRRQFVDAAVAAAPRLQQLGMQPNAYFQPQMVQFQGSLAPNLFFEQAATLSALEATKGIDLTKDPVLRQSLFKDQATRESYNAVTGLRQTRLDARDLAPYTRVPEPAPVPAAPPPSLWSRMLGMVQPAAAR